MSKRVLIVDDSPVIRQQVRRCLESETIEVTDADGGTAGLARAAEQAYDLIISDVNMPDLDGMAMVEQIRRLPGYEKVPIFMLTTESSRELAQRGKAIGATVWIVKPFDPALLLRGVSRVLER